MKNTAHTTNHTTEDSMDAIEATYRDAIAKTGSTASATRALIKTHGIGFKEACEMSWIFETGEKAPNFKRDRKANAAWDRGFERKNRRTA